jgi:hypothetical protein
MTAAAVGRGILTRNDIACVHGILILDEGETIHELHLGDLSGAMGSEVVLDVGLGSYFGERSASVVVAIAGREKRLSV